MLCIALLLSASLSGCFGKATVNDDGGAGDHWLPAVEDRYAMQYLDTDVFSRVSINGTFAIEEVRSIFVDVPAISLSDGGGGVVVPRVRSGGYCRRSESGCARAEAGNVP